MRLKHIKLAGFKSFVDPTTVAFPSNMGAVVGPNGCGKSNIIDAVRWVMGESSARTLRGEHMTDVIFNGSGSRKPVGQASVELVFDNPDGRLSGEYANFAEVSIRRKVERDGQSAYFLNGARCRRRDVTDIFLGTGLGARSYSIIEQGMVSRLIESKPEELRLFVEEAAGVSRYKERRRETENRIRRTRDNLARLADIREELERQLERLRRQAAAAEKYGELKRQERTLGARIGALRWRALDEEIKAGDKEAGELGLALEKARAEQRRLDAEAEQRLADNAGLVDAHAEVQGRYFALGNDIARIEQSISHHDDRVGQLRLDLEDTRSDRDQTRAELDADLGTITRMESDLGTLAPRLDAAKAAEAAAAAALVEAEAAAEQWQEDRDAFNRRAAGPRQAAGVQESQIRQLEDQIARGRDRRRRLEEESEALGDGSAERDTERLAELEAAAGELGERMAGQPERIEGIRRELAGCRSRLDAARGGLQVAQGRLSSLEALQQAALGRDDRTLDRWLRDNGLSQRPRLAEGLEIEAGWERAVESVLGDAMQAVCVNGSGIAGLAGALSEPVEARVALVDPGGTRAEPRAGAAGLEPLAGKIGGDWDVSGLVQGVYAVSGVEQALSSVGRLGAGESVITAEGVWLGPGWARLCQPDNGDSIVRRRGEIEALGGEIGTLEAACAELEGERGRLEAALEAAEADRDGLQADLTNSRLELGEVKSRTEKRRRLRRELGETEAQLAADGESAAAAQAELRRALGEMEADSVEADALKARRETAYGALEACRKRAREAKDAMHRCELERQSIEARLKSTREAMDRMATQLQRAKERTESLSGQIAKSEAPLAALRAELNGALEKRLAAERELGEAKTKVDDNEHAMRELDRRRADNQRERDGVQQSLMESRLKSEGAAGKRDAVAAQLADAGFRPEGVLEELPDGFDEAACGAELERVAGRIQRLGAINLAAVEERRQQSERKEYLDQQNEDLEKALNTLRNAIRKIDRETRTRFKETFDKINGGLQSIFPRVFGGGHAYLEMTGDDLLDTGIAIMARPPGKRNSTIHLLSGGEKAMTAIALVFAIFHLNPSPFCMLDEVDAPLDDNNVGRYANLLKEMSANVQFIFITHNKITMEMASQLVGVTMQEPGVSRMVAVDIDQAAELAGVG